jgi:hypothetical protein
MDGKSFAAIFMRRNKKKIEQAQAFSFLNDTQLVERVPQFVLQPIITTNS